MLMMNIEQVSNEWTAEERCFQVHSHLIQQKK